MSISLTIESDIINGEKLDYLVIDGISIDDAIDIISEKNNRLPLIKEVIKKTGISTPLRIDKKLWSDVCLMNDLYIPEYDLTRVNREQVLVTLEKRCIGLRVSETLKTGKLERLVKAALPHDRFVSLAHYQGGFKRADAALGVWLVMLEIDDINIFDAVSELGMEILETLAKPKIQACTIALNKIIKYDMILPFMVVYSGKKSFHCFWQFDKSLNKDEILELQKVKDFYIKEAQRREIKTKADSELLKVDPQPFFSSTALGRIPCRKLEENRFEQIAWKTGFPGIISKDKIKDAIVPVLKHIKSLQQINIIHKQAMGYDKGIREFYNPTEGDILAVFPEAKHREKGGFLIKCPFHEDGHSSAFITPAGFIYCSVCSDTDNKWIGKLARNGVVEKLN